MTPQTFMRAGGPKQRGMESATETIKGYASGPKVKRPCSAGPSPRERETWQTLSGARRDGRNRNHFSLSLFLPVA